MRVDYPLALKAIEKSSYSVIVSDLNHFSPAGIVTDRAAFEILEWARDTGKEIKLIISTGYLTEKRIRLAHDLGAVGICNTLQKLNQLLTEATGQKIDYPPKFAAGDAHQQASIDEWGAPKEQGSSARCHALVSYSQADRKFVEQLVRDLRNFGIDCWVDRLGVHTAINAGVHKLARLLFRIRLFAFLSQVWRSSSGMWRLGSGAAFEVPIRRMIREADVMFAIFSSHSLESSWFQREVYEGIAKEGDTKRAFLIPLVIDNDAVDAVEKFPYVLRAKGYVDFRGDYNIALKALVEALPGKSELLASLGSSQNLFRSLSQR
jgi:hypothetical protein